MAAVKTPRGVLHSKAEQMGYRLVRVAVSETRAEKGTASHLERLALPYMT